MCRIFLHCSVVNVCGPRSPKTIMPTNEDNITEERRREVGMDTYREGASIMCRNLIGFFLLGLCTHLPYTVMNTAANTIAESYNESSFVATVYGAGNGATIVVKNINAFLLCQVPYGARFFTNTAIMLSGIVGLAFAKSFSLAILSIVLVGASNAFGENIALGYLSRFDSRIVAAWASGYASAGLLGALLYVLFGCLINGAEDSQDKLRNLDKWAFISVVPAAVAYLAVSLRLIKENESPHCKPIINRQNSNISSDDDPTTALLINTTDILRVQREEHIETSSHRKSQSRNDTLLTTGKDEVRLPLSAKIKVRLIQIMRCFKHVAWLAFNLAFVQFSSYTIRVAAAKARPTHDTTSCPELYASLQLCFQAGVFASQSSIPILKIKRVGLLTAVLTINMVLWVINDRYKFLPVALLPVLMVISGCLKGAVYVNVFYMIRTDSRIPNEDRDMSANVAGIFLTLGLSLSCISQTILFNTVLLPY